MERFRVVAAPRNGRHVRLEEQDLRDAFERRAHVRLLDWALEGDRMSLEVEAGDEPPVWDGIGYLWGAAGLDWEVTCLGPKRVSSGPADH